MNNGLARNCPLLSGLSGWITRHALACAFVFMTLPASAVIAQTAHVRIGVLAYRGDAATLSAWSETANYLTQHIANTKFEIVPLNNDTINAAVDQRSIDFVLTNPASYANLESAHGITRILTLRNRGFGSFETRFGAVIFTRADSRIHRLTDLRGVRMMAVHPDAFGGWWMAWRELKSAGIESSQLGDLIFNGFPQDEIVFAVAEGQVDAGTVRTETLERLSAEGKIKLDQFRVINQRIEVGFPFLTSTRLYPEWPLAVLRHTDTVLAKSVAIALLQMKEDEPAALAGNIAGWMTPLDYNSVHELMRELSLGVYAKTPDVSWRIVFDKHRDAIIGIAFAVGILFVAFLFSWELNRRLTLSTRSLELEVDQRQRAQGSLNDEKERLRVTLEAIGDAVITTDRDGTIEYMNPVAETLTGWSADEIAGKKLSSIIQLVLEDDDTPLPDPVEKCLAQGRFSNLAEGIVLIGRDGRRFAVHQTVSHRYDSVGRVSGVVLVFRDTTELQKLQREMRYAATHDELTGLLNRRSFEEQLRTLMRQPAAPDRNDCLLCIDLDHFKFVNDNGGHAAGDELLRQIARTFTESVRASDVVARLGGDEFAVLLQGCDLVAAERLAQKIVKDVFEQGFVWQTRVFAVSVSAGIAEIHPSGGNLQEVLRAADLACYVAKTSGRNQYSVYAPDHEAIQQRRGDGQWLQRIAEALQKNTFWLVLQEIVPVAGLSNNLKHYEVLLRLCNADGSSAMPGEFFPAAERHQITAEIDRWVVNATLDALANPLCRIESQATITINISGQSLGDDAFLDFIVEKMENAGLRGERLCFELTETAAIAHFRKTVRFMTRLRGMGCKFALDDFGSGMSSFSYLRSLPADFLKIDGSFIRNVDKSEIDVAMVRAITEVAHAMGMKAVAESVESESILSKLQHLGVDFAQGNAVSLPRPLSEFMPPPRRSAAAVIVPSPMTTS